MEGRRTPTKIAIVGGAGAVGATAAYALMMSGLASEIVLVDVRSANEFQNYNIRGSVHIQAPDLRTRQNELDADIPTILLCSTGNRSSLGASILKRAGFKDVYNVAGGMTGYSAAGYAPECMMCFIPHGPRFSQES